MTANDRVIRNRDEIEATVSDARRLPDVDGGAGGGIDVHGWLRAFDSRAARDRAVVEPATFCGRIGGHRLLCGVGEDVSSHCEVTT